MVTFLLDKYHIQVTKYTKFKLDQIQQNKIDHSQKEQLARLYKYEKIVKYLKTFT